MSNRKAFLLRVDKKLLEQIERWSADEFRSVNGQIEYVLRDALRRAGRLPRSDAGPPVPDSHPNVGP